MIKIRLFVSEKGNKSLFQRVSNHFIKCLLQKIVAIYVKELITAIITHYHNKHYYKLNKGGNGKNQTFKTYINI